MDQDQLPSGELLACDLKRGSARTMTDFSNLSNDLGKAFLVGVLLSGSFERTEQALVCGIAVLDVDENFREEILLWVVRTNVSAQSVTGGEVRAYLPPMLDNVLDLPARLRHCFVLRVLLGWPLDKCTKLLDTDAGAMEEQLIAAYGHLSKNDCSMNTK